MSAPNMPHAASTPSTSTFQLVANKLKISAPCMKCAATVNIENTSNPHQNKGSESATSIVAIPKSSRNLLLDLPPELRDEVYMYAFGDAPRAFVASKDTTVYALASASTYHAYVRYPDTVKGLPVWLLGCKQILTEAMDVFHRSRTYVVETDGRCPLSIYGRYEAPLRSHPNTLSYGGRRNISSFAFRPGSKVWSSVRIDEVYDESDIASVFNKEKDHDSELLDRIYHGLGQNPCLQLQWKRSWLEGPQGFGSNGLDWLEGEEEILDCFDAKWNGRFRKVNIAIEYSEKDRTMMTKMMELAENCSQRLVGKVQEEEMKFCWTEKIWDVSNAFPEFNTWVKTLVVERKI